MDKNYISKCNHCNVSSCKESKNNNGKKNYYHDKMESPSCPMFVVPVNCEDFQIFNILSCRVGKIVGLKLEGSDCILKLKVCQVNQFAVMGKTPCGKGPIYIKLGSIQYVDLGKEIYVNPLCSNSGGVAIPGPAGPKGDKGDMGPAGPKGTKGDMGPAGPKGTKGDIGTAGSKGDKGDMGPSGPKGDKGDMGPVGPKGDKGDMGPTGAKGPKGDIGPQGPAGTIVPPVMTDKEYKKKISPKK